MESYIKISNIGLAAKDTTLIRSILKLKPNLGERFSSIDDSKYLSADLLFINADDDSSLNIWSDAKKQEKHIIPVMVTARKGTIGTNITINRPMLIQRVIDALEKVDQQQLGGNTAISPNTNSRNDSNIATQNNSAASVRKKILIVDDSLSVRKYMEHKLPTLAIDANMGMDFADSGKSAMEKIKETAYHVVFLDVVMPEVDGYKVCKWIKSVRPTTRVIMLTSKKSPFDKVRGAMSGCDAYLTKPPSDEKLKELLNK